MQAKLRATLLEKNINRTYEIVIYPGLFNTFIVQYAWGKEGTKGQSKCMICTTEDEAVSFFNRKVKRRLTSQKRLGVNYQLVK